MNKKLSFEEFKKEILTDYKLAVTSRRMSIHARREVLSGKAKFGILGDGKEIAQLALSKNFHKGDWRSGYYRDQTWMLAKGMLTPQSYFAELYGDTDLQNNPIHGGRLMNNHFGSRNLDKNGVQKNHTEMYNSATDISPTAAQMLRAVGLGYASKLYRENDQLGHLNTFSNQGNEVTFVTIGDASTSEGHFWEAMNAASVLQIPMAVSVWDDGWGISVPKSLQTTKASISKALAGFEKNKDSNGILIYKGKGWDYAGLCKIYEEGIKKCREEQIPVLFHIEEMTQPQGHSTSGSHERYKSKERLQWEDDFDPIRKMKIWILEKNIATEEQLNEIEHQSENEVVEARNNALKSAFGPVQEEKGYILEMANELSNETLDIPAISDSIQKLKEKVLPVRADIVTTTHTLYNYLYPKNEKEKELKQKLLAFLLKTEQENRERFDTFLYSESSKNPTRITHTKAIYDREKKDKTGREILRDNFKVLFEKYPELVTFGEDVGVIGGVNQCLQGMQDAFGDLRVTDTGIREATIVGQGIGMAMRGLRPIAEIQYLDYLMYGLQILSDDLACLHYRTVGGQSAPLIIRTRGHRLEGVWHSGSYMSTIINAVRGIYVCVPRNMTQASGFYNTLIQGDSPALVIEPLNAYRRYEPAPQNLGEYTTPLGVPEIIEEGEDLTIVTYGACVAIAQEAIKILHDFDISVELIDIQTLIPFDIHHKIVSSVKKTGKILFVDEDVPGGATAYMMQKVVEIQKASQYLKVPARTLSAKSHRPAYGNDGDFFSKPNAVTIFDIAYEIMNEFNETLYPNLYDK